MRSIVFLFFFLVSVNLYGQDLQFSQYDNLPLLLNPAFAGITDRAEARYNFRNQWLGSDSRVASQGLNLSKPLFLRRNNCRHWAGVGLSVFDDRTNDQLFIQNGLTLSFSILVPIGKYSFLSFGLNGGYQWRRLNLENISTGNQFVEGLGFDPSQPIGEQIDNTSVSIPTFGTGLMWHQRDKSGDVKSFLSVAAFDLNQPNEAFISGDSELPVALRISGKYQIYESKQWILGLDANITSRGSDENFLLGVYGEYDLYRLIRNVKNYDTKIVLSTRYSEDRALIVGGWIDHPSYRIGVSIDLDVEPNSDLNAFRNAVEFSLAYKTPWYCKPKTKKNRRKRSKSKKNKNKKTTSLAEYRRRNRERLQREHSEKESQTEDKDTIEVVSLEQIEAEKEFELKLKKVLEPVIIEFDFDETEVISRFEFRLHNLLEFMTEYEEFDVMIMGHTDNSGSHEYNLRLGQKRANTVKKFLIENGISEDRIYTESKGESEPLNDNSTNEMRRRNRRVEVKVIE
ncbi:MAG: PorP/SprF family type IX secretion system membrane protein [Bacteroidota bacterium]